LVTSGDDGAGVLKIDPATDERKKEAMPIQKNQAKPQLDYPIIVHCHLRWEGVWQRPQQFLSRISNNHRVLFVEGPQLVENDEPPVEYIKPYKNPPDALHPYTKFRMDMVQAQDHMAWETQGPIADRTNERLTSSDRGVILLRGVMFRELKKVQQGHDPMGIVRDPANNPFIDTHLLESIAQIGDDRAPRAVNQ
jgi:hypothetical protein